MTFRLVVLSLITIAATAFSPIHSIGTFTRHNELGYRLTTALEAKPRKQQKVKDSGKLKETVGFGSKPALKIKADPPPRDPIKGTEASKPTLKTEDLPTSDPIKASVGPKPAPKAKPDLSARDLIKEEMNARSLLASRLSLEAMLRSRIVKDVGPKPTLKTKAELLIRDPIKEEMNARSLLASRLALEVTIRSRIVKDVGPKPTLKTKPEIVLRNPIQEEKNARNLLATRLTFEKASVLAKRKRGEEKRQRGVLAHRLAMQSMAWGVQQEKHAAIEALRLARQQPKSPEQEQLLASKYGAIECPGEKAFMILKDLGMV